MISPIHDHYIGKYLAEKPANRCVVAFGDACKYILV